MASSTNDESGGSSTARGSLTSAPAAVGTVRAEVLDVMSDLLLGVGEGSPPDAFFSSLCEAICRLTSMQRAVLFRYDDLRRRVRAVGAHGIELERFADLFVTIDSVPTARQALVEDRILEVIGARDFDVPSSVQDLFDGIRIICTPMAAADRYVGVVLSEREAGTPEMDEEERHLLWTLGKAIAMASVAREATRYDEQRRQLQTRIDLAREIHERVVQRLFGVGLALSQEHLLDADAQKRCSVEVQGALADLQTVLGRALSHVSRPTTVTLADELDRVRALNAGLEIVVEEGDPGDVPQWLQGLAQSVLVEAVRNVRKHSSATVAGVSLERLDGTFTITIRNDGVQNDASATRGIGLRLATLEALQHDAVLEYGEYEPGCWQVRLVAPAR